LEKSYTMTHDSIVCIGSIQLYRYVSFDRSTDVTGEILNLWYWFYVEKFLSCFVAPSSGARGV